MKPLQPIIVVDAFKTIVEQISAELTSELQAIDSNITGVHYLHGHPLEIIETLGQRDKSKNYIFDKYPLIGLFQDFPETISGKPGFSSEVSLHLIIARATQNTYKANERYTYNFKPILYPIYTELLSAIGNSPAFMTYGQFSIPHIKTDRLFWGREGLYGNTGNIFNDWIDCIEIKNLKLKVNLKLC